MPTVTTQFATISCDNPECTNEVTFQQTKEAEAEAFAANPWMNGLRFINTVDQRTFLYCSDECELKGVASGIHNKQVIVQPQGPNQVDMAAQAAERARQATAALKSGQGKVVLG